MHSRFNEGRSSTRRRRSVSNNRRRLVSYDYNSDCFSASCIAQKNLTVLQPSTNIVLEGFLTTLDVYLIQIKDQNTQYFPNNLGNLFPDLRYVLNEDSQLVNVSKNNFEGMANVKDVILINNLIEEIPHNAFEYLVNLEIIDLHNNKLTLLDKNTFSNNRKLEKVYAFENQIEILEADLFKHNDKLVLVDFDRNKLIAIKTVFDTTKSYQLISFRDNECIDSTYPIIDLGELFEEIFLKCYGPLFLDPR